MSEAKIIPRLRFSSFINNWEKKYLKSISKVKGRIGFRGYTKSDLVEKGNGALVLGGKNISDYRLDLSERTFLNWDKYHESPEIKIKKEDIILSQRGTLGDVAIIDREIGDSTINPSMVVLKEININPYFLFFQLCSERIQTTIKRITTSTAVPMISQKQIGDFIINTPSLPEQQKIADFLTAVDKRIELLEKKKTLLETYKKGVMKKIFNQEIRFKDDNGDDFPDWELFKLNDVLFEHKQKNNESKFDEVFSVSKQKGVINQIEHLGRSYSAETIDHYKLINNWDIVYTKSPTSDFPFGIIKQNITGRTGVLSPLYGVFRPKNKWIGKMIASYFESWVNTYNYLIPLVQKGAKNTMNINNNTFLNGKQMKLPTSECEQEKISKFLFSIEGQLELLESQIDKSKTWKKGLLQKMFV